MEFLVREKKLWFSLLEVDILIYRINEALKNNDGNKDQLVDLRQVLDDTSLELKTQLRCVLQDAALEYQEDDGTTETTEAIIKEAKRVLDHANNEWYSKEIAVKTPEKKIQNVNGKWTPVFADQPLDPTTPVGRLVRDYERQLKNILSLEKERNLFQLKAISLESKLKEIKGNKDY